MALLKTVFEVNLGLFGGGSDVTKPRYVAYKRGLVRMYNECQLTSRSKEKTLILFVIRDHVGATPMANLTATLRSDMDKIWASLSKVGSLYHYVVKPHKHLIADR
jgi:hypothetical protein